MTREEAIEFGNMWLEVNEDFKDSDVDDRNTYEFFQIAIKALEQEPKWIPVSERLPMLDEEACSDDVLIQLKDTKFSISEGACSIHITKIARYDENAISSDGRYMDTEGWILDNGYTLSMDEVIAWMPLPKSLKAESEEVCAKKRRYGNVKVSSY